jgi:uncharacterized protein with von Willebrand factor type A (vWA) domain
MKHYTIIITVDTSGSMSGTPIKKAKDAAVEFIRKVDLTRFRVGVMACANRCQMIAVPASEYNQITDALEQLPDYVNRSLVGGGNSADPFDDCKAVLISSPYRDSKKVILVLTDGVWSNQPLAIQKAKECHRVGIDVIAIGFGSADEAFLKAISSSSEDALFTDLNNLSNTFENIAKNLMMVRRAD